jgi:MoaA/NifB/PqqE/SkfB family radical SAM enzyme
MSFCQIPFEKAMIHDDGSMHVCQPPYGFTKEIPLGNILKEKPEIVWNSEIAQKIRKSILNGSFEYCGKNCRSFVSKDKLENKCGYESIVSAPRHISLFADNTCNLHCWYCRSAKYRPSQRFSRRIYDSLSGFLSKIETLLLLCYGEPFSSEPTIEFLEKFDPIASPNLRIRLQTNGQLFTRKKWERMNHSGMIDMVSVSVDAASKMTYEKLRLGGSWETLNENIPLIVSLKTEKFRFVETNFVVMSDNFREVLQFINKSKEWGVDLIFFDRLADFGVLSKEFLKKRDVIDPDHPDHLEFKSICDSIPKDSNKPLIRISDYVQ